MTPEINMHRVLSITVRLAAGFMTAKQSLSTSQPPKMMVANVEKRQKLTQSSMQRQQQNHTFADQFMHHP